jgi:hypothetical protein
MPSLAVYSINGKGTREITVPGRSPLRPFGSIRIQNNVGQRQESDWPAIKAALAAGDVVICLSPYEADVLPEQIQGKVGYGGNVRFDTRRPPSWRLIEEDAFCSFQAMVQCMHCNELFESKFRLGEHVHRKHRDIAERIELEA